MSKLNDYIGSQFGNPHGIIGFFCCKCMNIINQQMYKKTVSILSLDKNQKLLDIGIFLEQEALNKRLELVHLLMELEMVY